MGSQKDVWLEKHGRLHAVAPSYIFLQVWLSDVGMHTFILFGALAVRQVVGDGCR